MITTLDHWHTKIAVEAMLAGKDVYCEKPLTLTIDEGKLIEKMVKQTRRVFQVGRCNDPSAINDSCKRSHWSKLDASARSNESHVASTG